MVDDLCPSIARGLKPGSAATPATIIIINISIITQQQQPLQLSGCHASLLVKKSCCTTAEVHESPCLSAIDECLDPSLLWIPWRPSLLALEHYGSISRSLVSLQAQCL
jgi:hypothetical protein